MARELKVYKNPARFCRLQSLRLSNIKEVYDDKQIRIAQKWFIGHMPEVVLILETGVRRGEIAGWLKSDFDIRNKVYHVRRAVTAQRGGILKEGAPKSGSYRT